MPQRRRLVPEAGLPEPRDPPHLHARLPRALRVLQQERPSREASAGRADESLQLRRLERALLEPVEDPEPHRHGGAHGQRPRVYAAALLGDQDLERCRRLQVCAAARGGLAQELAERGGPDAHGDPLVVVHARQLLSHRRCARPAVRRAGVREVALGGGQLGVDARPDVHERRPVDRPRVRDPGHGCLPGEGQPLEQPQARGAHLALDPVQRLPIQPVAGSAGSVLRDLGSDPFLHPVRD
mmetsp:Transcript_3814/g.7720  ORF Transcript_3814/g.7720 Transcript_3814/m.7720 type:complete len:240 (-) Transcript_3814:1574-2293(-)